MQLLPRGMARRVCFPWCQGSTFLCRHMYEVGQLAPAGRSGVKGPASSAQARSLEGKSFRKWL